MTTHWSAVLAAIRDDSPSGQAALAELCQIYWYPLYAFIRRQGHLPHDAEDLTQAFFAKLLEKNYLMAANRERGKFRSFLLVTLKRFLANERDRRTSLKRGGQVGIIPMDQAEGEARYRLEPAHELTAERLFEQRWAQTLLDRVLARLQQEYVEAGKRKLFATLQGCLSRPRGGVRYAELAARLNLSEAAVKMAVQRLRARYRRLLRLEIAKTVSGTQEVEEEIQYLFKVFAS